MTASSGNRVRIWAAASMLAGAGLMQDRAIAVVAITGATTEVSLSYTFDGTAASTGALLPLVNEGSLQQDGGIAGQASRVTADWTSTVTQDGGFHFLSNIQCIGVCSMLIQTITTLTLTNDSAQDAAMRIDSQILPGHIGVIGTGAVNGSYLFTAGQTSGGSNSSVSQNGLALYSDQTSGHSLYTVYNLPSGATQPAFLNSLTYYTANGNRPPDGMAVDFDATNLNLPVDVAANSTVDVVYTSQLLLSSTAACADIVTCSGAQVVFGDPRNSGGTGFDGGDLARGIRLSTFKPTTTPEAVIDRKFGVYETDYAVVAASDPLPPQPPASTPPIYVAGLFTSAVPESSSWTMMLLGFGAIGAMARGRRHAARLISCG